MNETALARRRSLECWARIGVLFVAFGLRLWGLNARSLWFDEAIEYWSAHVPLLAIPDTVAAALQPPLFSILLHFWSEISVEALWLRLGSVFISLLGVAGMMVLGRRLRGNRGGLIAGLITAFLPTEVRYAQEVAEYALLGGCLVWSLVFLEMAARNGRWSDWLAWGGLAGAGLITHYGAIFPIAVTAVTAGLFYLRCHRRRSAVLRPLTGGLVAVGVSAPALIYFLPAQLQRLRVDAATGPITSLWSEGLAVVQGIRATFLFQLMGWPFPAWHRPGTIMLATGLIVVVLLLSIAEILWSPTYAKTLVALWFWGTILVYSCSVELGWYGHGSFGFRYGLILTPLFVLAATLGIVQITQYKQGLAASFLLAAFLVISGYSLPNRPLSALTRPGQAWPETQDMRELVDYWVAQHRPGQVTYIDYFAAPAYRYYSRLKKIDLESLPPAWFTNCWGIQNRGKFCSANQTYYGAWLESFSLQARMDLMKETMNGWPTSLWMVFSHTRADEDQPIMDELVKQHYQVVQKRLFTGAAAYLLERR